MNQSHHPEVGKHIWKLSMAYWIKRKSADQIIWGKMFNLGCTLMRCWSMYKFLSNLIVRQCKSSSRRKIHFRLFSSCGEWHGSRCIPNASHPRWWPVDCDWWRPDRPQVAAMCTPHTAARGCNIQCRCSDAPILEYSNAQMSMLGLKLHLLRARACRTGFRFQED